MPDIEEILEILQKNVDEARERVSHLLEEDGLRELPHRFYDQLVIYISAVHNAVTAGGTLPALPLPSLQSLGLGTPEKRLPLPPPAPVTYWERTVKHVKGRPYFYSALGGATFTLVSTVIAVHVSPAFRAYLFGSMPFLKPIYLKQRKALPCTPRPRASADGRQRLEIVLVLGCDQGSYGREVAKALERQGFIVIASVSRESEVDELEIAGKGFINAIVLDENSTDSSRKVSSFIRSLSTALSLRYPLHSPGDPFQYITPSNPGAQLVSVINCLPLARPDGLALPLEALPSESIAQAMERIVVTPMLLLQSLVPLLRTSHDPHGLPATMITCLQAPDRYVGTPFTGSSSAIPGIASNALASALDVLRRELSLVESRSRRKIKIVNLDVGFLQPVSTKRSHRGVSSSPETHLRPLDMQDVQRNLPAHLRDMYAPALLANCDRHAESSRKRMPGAAALSDKLLEIVLATKARHIPDRASVGVGVRTYYMASLLPTSFIDLFFSFRQRLLTGASTKSSLSGAQTLGSTSRSEGKGSRCPLPFPGEASTSSAKAAEAAQEQQDVHSDVNDDTILPPYAPSAPGSAQSSTYPSQVHSPMDTHGSMCSERSASGSGSGSGLDESFVRV